MPAPDFTATLAARDAAFSRFEASRQPANVEFGDWLAANDRPLFEAVSALEEAGAL